MEYKQQYKNALEKARELLSCCIDDRDRRTKIYRVEDIESIFPELKEDEDERIRKKLICFVENWKKFNPNSPFDDYAVYTSDSGECDKILAWLEKQGEQKPTDKVEPKFHEGDWIIHQGTENIYQVIARIDNQYQLKYGDNYTIQKCADVDRCARLWTIQDAKDGDVLVDSYSKDSIIILYKGIYKERTILAHCGWNGYNLSVNTNGFGYGGLDNTNYLPATKEQCDLLFQKIKEAGYEWDAEEKELKKIEPNPDWSEKDEEMLTWLCRIIHSQRLSREITLKEESELGKWMDKWLNHNPQTKQGKKTANEIEPKFHKDDWIVSKVTGSVYQIENCIENLSNHKYGYDLTNGGYISSDNAKLWTVADAKEGDVLVCPSDLGDRLVVFIFKQLVNNASEIDCHCCIDANGIFDPCLNDCCYVGDVSRADYIPATKEQRDLLFQKMKDAGYEWDAEKKELKRIGQKSVDKTESKFKVGDWIVNNVCLPMQIASIKDGMYIFTEGDAISVSFIDENYHLWTIEDAKDGDVLACNEEILLLKSYSVQGRISLYCWYNGQTNDFHSKEVVNTSLTKGNKIYPATKEQCDTLFTKMKEAGYEWDANKKELKKIELRTLDPDCDFEYYVKQFKQDFGL